MAVAKNIGMGWHFQSVRHSNARRFGRASGKYARQSKTALKLANEYAKLGNSVASKKLRKQYLKQSKTYGMLALEYSKIEAQEKMLKQLTKGAKRKFGQVKIANRTYNLNQKKFERVMKEFVEGKLKSSSGEQITDRRQALAIAFSEARKYGSKDDEGTFLFMYPKITSKQLTEKGTFAEAEKNAEILKKAGVFNVSVQREGLLGDWYAVGRVEDRDKKKAVNQMLKKIEKRKHGLAVSQPPFESANILPVQVSTIVPSTKGNEQVSSSEFRKRVNDVKKEFDKKFGGDTTINETGSYLMSGKLVKERGAIVESSTNKSNYEKSIKEITHFIEDKRKKWKQDTMLLKVEGTTLITPKKSYIPNEEKLKNKMIEVN